MILTKEALNKFAEFVKQVEVDGEGRPANVEYCAPSGRWVTTIEKQCLSIIYFDLFKYRIKPKPKMRPMDYRDAKQLLGLKVKKDNEFATINFVNEDFVVVFTFSNLGIVYVECNFEDLFSKYTHLDGSKLEVQDENDN